MSDQGAGIGEGIVDTTELFHAEPIVKHGEQWLHHPDLEFTRMMGPMMKRARKAGVLPDLLAFIHLNASPSSRYREMADGEREETIMRDHIRKQEDLKALDKDGELTAAISWYASLVRTRSERLYLTLCDQVDSFISRIADQPMAQDLNQGAENILDAIEKGQTMLEQIKKMKAYIRSEGSKRNRSGYEVKLFENRDQA